MSVQAKSEKNLQCWRKNYMSNNEISIFGLIFLFFDTTDIIILRQQLKASTVYWLFFLTFDVCFLRQWLQFYIFSFIFSGPDITFLRQHSFLPGADIFFLCHCNDFLWFSCTDICFLCQCSEFLKKLVFSYHWHKNFMSATP